MRLHVHARVPLAVLVLASMLAGCDPKSTEVGATANLGAPTGGDASGSSSDTGAGSMGCEEGKVALISGTVHRELGDHTWNESFEPTPEAFVHLLHTSYSDDFPTGIGERLVPFEGLPFDFALCLPEELSFKFEDDKDYDFLVHVFNHDTTELRVGDLVDEYHYPIDRPTHGLQVVVGGVEHCDAPYADELCSTIE